MAKVSKGGDARKVSFGKRKKGRSCKTHNRHDRTEKNYRGQGR